MLDRFGDAEWKMLAQIRAGFLGAAGGLANYWQSPTHIDVYDQTFAQRIGWKWDAVIRDLVDAGWGPPPQARVLDWGCGSGIAARKFWQRWGGQCAHMGFFDRSSQAMEFAQARLLQQFPSAIVRSDALLKGSYDVLLISHVINEMTDVQVEELVSLCRQVNHVLWVEAGTHFSSRRLGQVRQVLKESHTVIRPCGHQGSCGIFDADRQADWCHFFASSPPEVHQSAFWRRFATEMSIDLRSLPVSYLVASRGSIAGDLKIQGQKQRILGRAREFKGYCTFQACDENGVHDERYMKRESKDEYKRLCKGDFSLWRSN